MIAVMGGGLGTAGASAGSIEGACEASRGVANSLKADRLRESMDSVPDSLLATAARWSHRVLAP